LSVLNLDVPKAMTIAGSDSGAGAGIQADLKTFAAFGVYGTSVLTAVTAQNTIQVAKIYELPTTVVAAQIKCVISDIGAHAVKTGMLFSRAIILIVVRELKRAGVDRLVVDPVMVAKSGDRLLKDDAVDVLRSQLLPMAMVVTPNIPEAEVLVGRKITRSEDVREAAQMIQRMGPKVVVVKGGHLPGVATDLYYDGSIYREFSSPRIQTKNNHGTGCTFSSATAAGLARGLGPEESVEMAKRYVTDALREAYDVGSGHGPVNHFYKGMHGQ
jgi:hydroxymethylpyrimidine/phosphomethylpyrimidine kinase